MAGLARELRPGREAAAPALSSDLERDLGIGSLERLELTRRLEEALSGTLPDSSRPRACVPSPWGPFQAAAEAGVPVLPVAIRGSRRAMAPDRWIPVPGEVAVLFGEPLAPRGSDWGAVVELAARAREAIAARCGEPLLEARIARHD